MNQKVVSWYDTVFEPHRVIAAGTSQTPRAVIAFAHLFRKTAPRGRHSQLLWTHSEQNEAYFAVPSLAESFPASSSSPPWIHLYLKGCRDEHNAISWGWIDLSKGLTHIRYCPSETNIITRSSSHLSCSSISPSPVILFLPWAPWDTQSTGQVSGTLPVAIKIEHLEGCSEFLLWDAQEGLEKNIPAQWPIICVRWTKLPALPYR